MSTQVSVRWWYRDSTGLSGRSGATHTATCLTGVELSVRLLGTAGAWNRPVVRSLADDSPELAGERSRQSVHDDRDAGRTPRLLTDGGEPVSETDPGEADRHEQLQRIFEELVGSDSVPVVESQERDSRRCLDSYETALAEDVADVVESDGLSDAISSPDRHDGMRE
jgi:hypothetical protein